MFPLRFPNHIFPVTVNQNLKNRNVFKIIVRKLVTREWRQNLKNIARFYVRVYCYNKEGMDTVKFCQSLFRHPFKNYLNYIMHDLINTYVFKPGLSQEQF